MAKIVAARRQAHPTISSDDPTRIGEVKRVIWRFWDAGFERSCEVATLRLMKSWTSEKSSDGLRG